MSDSPRSGQDNRKRLLEDEVRELRLGLLKLESRLYSLFLILALVLLGFLLLFLSWAGLFHV